ncbi:mechanosensitive ion channel family protein [Rhodoferax fermentans]|uniref:Mechanosensitive ion channel protein n=1 Tax=Rhodoferax fermentans TaxID=28066 RepID=A0A1T1AV90_RHOFE|nr:mechanosensitive ion channel domain-containing protein [Rhodoferax fermentans]MBK1685669.1 mechanosensitive ion channel protein [Rhodoferax fermentans]OOV07953.1 mechanosensitive ion channel protein [Rhodoferax fermentans]
MSEVQPDDLQTWLEALVQTRTLIELAVLLGCALLAWLLANLAARAFVGRDANSITFGRRIVDGVLFPALWLALAYLARQLLGHSLPLAAFKIAIPVLMSLLVIRLGVKVLQAAFKETPLIRFLERTISWLAWLAMVLWVSGLLPVVMEELDQISWKVGSSQLSVRKIIEGSLTAGLVLIITLWISSALESKLLRHVTGGELSLRKAFSNAAKALLMFVGLLLAMSAVGIDMSALSVLGGAVGVGIGFGLQKLAANYVSGFVILAERSMRIGDTVQVDNFNGVITEINARYTVIRSLSGRESIVPNEMLITSRVENLSLADPKVWQSTTVSVGYESDVDLVTRLLLQAASQQERVLQEPGPAVALMNFGADGLEFRLGYWIRDPENGSDNLRSSINLAILQLLRENRVEIPFPQRVIHQRAA